MSNKRQTEKTNTQGRQTHSEDRQTEHLTAIGEQGYKERYTVPPTKHIFDRSEVFGGTVAARPKWDDNCILTGRQADRLLTTPAPAPAPTVRGQL